MLWMPPSQPQTLLLQPVVVRAAMAAEKTAAAEPAEKKEQAEASGNEAADSSQTPAVGEDRVQALNEREKALDKREAELRVLEMELDDKLKNLKALEVRMQKLIDSAGAIQDEKMVHLVNVYSNMKPKQAAQVLETLDEPIAVRILAGMSGRKAGEILSSVRADRAAALSEALTRLQTGND
jgi:flagellar motility protein MotE (MotC chaperone)